MPDISSPTVYIPAIFLTLTAIFVTLFYKDSKKHTRENTRDLPYYQEITTSMLYICLNTLENGRFRYSRNVSSDIEYENETYNSLRHAGVLYSLYMYEKYGLENKFKDVRLRATEYFLKKYVKPFGKDKYCVLSIPNEEKIKIPIAKSGAAGIALCALSNLLPEELIDRKILEGLGNFILTMQQENGNICAYVDLSAKKINKTAEALYYPAQAATGLLYLYEVDPQEKWLTGAKKALLYLAESRKPLEMEIPFDHWSALATEKLFKLNLVTPDEKKILQAFCEQMAIPMLRDQITNKNNSYYGAFKDNVRPCSLGTIMEGLASVYECTESESLKSIIFKSLSIGCMFLSRVQVKTGEQAGGLPNSANWVKPGVTPNASVIRIDNVWHVANGWLKFQKIMKTTGNY